MGFDTDQFEGDINEELICSICAGVLSDPLTTHCDHLFCSECIHDWLREHNTCPIDRCQLRACMLRPAPRVIRNLINRLPIYCDFQADGCKEVITLEQYVPHLETCQFNPSRLVKCKLWCHRTMTLRTLKHHNCVNELADQVGFLRVQIDQLQHERQVLLVGLAVLLILYIFCPITNILQLIPNV